MAPPSGEQWQPAALPKGTGEDVASELAKGDPL